MNQTVEEGTDMNCNEGLGLESRIKTSYGRLLPAEKKIADYILGHESLPALDIDTLARKTETSKASVSRFCRRLGYGGFKEFSLHLARECAEARTDASDHIARIVEANAQASLDTHYLLDEETVEKVARAIAGAGRI